MDIHDYFCMLLLCFVKYHVYLAIRRGFTMSRMTTSN